MRQGTWCENQCRNTLTIHSRYKINALRLHFGEKKLKQLPFATWRECRLIWRFYRRDIPSISYVKKTAAQIWSIIRFFPSLRLFISLALTMNATNKKSRFLTFGFFSVSLQKKDPHQCSFVHVRFRCVHNWYIELEVDK